MLVILKNETSAPSAALRLMTRQFAQLLCMSSSVVAFVTDGVSAMGATVSRKVSEAVLPPLVTVTVLVMGPLANVFLLAAGVIVSVKGELAPVTTRLALGTIVVSLDVTAMLAFTTLLLVLKLN